MKGIRSLRLLRLERISSLSLSSRCYYRNYTNTIDNNEIEKFSKIGKDWWDKGSNKGTGPLHAMNPTRGISLFIKTVTSLI